MGWLPIETAPRDGTEFQAWVVGGDNYGFWEPHARFDPETEAFQMYSRVDYDEDDWDTFPQWTPTHWMPEPRQPGIDH